MKVSLFRTDEAYCEIKEIDRYIRTNGFNDVLVKVAIAFVANCEVGASVEAQHDIYIFHQLHSVTDFIWDIWNSLWFFEPDDLDEVSKDNSKLVLWIEVFKLHWILRS